MTQQLKFQGRIHEFPDDFTETQIQEALATFETPSPQTMPRRRRPNGRQLGIAASALVAAGTLAAAPFMLGRTPPAPPAPSLPPTTRVAFRVEPDSAEITVDGRSIDGSAVTLSRGRHLLRISAAEHEPDSGEFVAEADSMVLERRLRPRVSLPAAGSGDSAPAAVYGSIVVRTPDVEAVWVSLDARRHGRTAAGRLRMDSLRPGTYVVSVQREGYCVGGAPSTRVRLAAGATQEVRFALGPRPRLRVATLLDARFTIDSGGPSYPVNEDVPVDPGRHRIAVSAAGHRYHVQRVDLVCGDSALVPVTLATGGVDSPLVPPPASPSPVPASCAPTDDTWAHPTADCFYGDVGSSGTYDFELRSQRVKRRLANGYRGVPRFGPWLVGSLGHHVEFDIEDGSLRWREGDGHWQDAGALGLPRDQRSIVVRLRVQDGRATFEFETDGGSGGAPPAPVAVPGTGLGVRAETWIRRLPRAG